MIFVIDGTNIERISEAHEELAKLMAEKRLKDALLLIFANKQVHVCLKNFFFMISSIVLQLQYYMQKRALIAHIRYIKILTRLESFLVIFLYLLWFSFVLKSLLGTMRQWSHKTFAILSLKPN